MTFNAARFETLLKAGSQLDLVSAYHAFRTANARQIIETAEEACDVIAPVVPGAADVKLALTLLVVLDDMYEGGYIKAAAVEDPAMQRVTGSKAR